MVQRPDAERTPRVWVGRSELVYVGPALGVRPHSTAVPRVLVGLDEPFTLGWGAEERTTWCAYVPPRVRHRVLTPGRWWAVAYLEPGSHRDLRCRTDLPERADLLAAGGLDSGRSLLAALGPDGRPESRLEAVLDRTLGDPGAPLPAEEAAALAGLSVSQFLREFGGTTGTSFRRFRQWARLLEATRRAPGSLTAISADAGFASPSHFSDTVRAIFGFTASELLATGAVVAEL